MRRAAYARAALRQLVAVLVAIIALLPLLSGVMPAPPDALAVTRTGNLWTVAAGNSAEIQPAIDAARDNGGGQVRLPQAVYLLTAKVRLHNNVTVYGDGMDKTVLRWAPGAAIDHMMSNGSLTAGNTNIQVWDLTLDGQGLSKAGDASCCFGLRLNNVQNSTFVNVAADSHSKDGIYVGYNRTNGAINVRLSGCRANNNARNGISLIHGNNNVIDHCTVNGNNRGEAVAGIDVEPDEGRASRTARSLRIPPTARTLVFNSTCRTTATPRATTTPSATTVHQAMAPASTLCAATRISSSTTRPAAMASTSW